jgi:mRNA interferase RelE/StbE
MLWSKSLAWQIEIDEAAKKELGKIDPQVARRVIQFLRTRLQSLKDPRSIGQALKGSELGDFWKYRLGDIRIIASIEDDRLVILVLRVGNRKEIYRR